ncbi:caspase family protein [Actinotalea sp. K2]|uniref:caspase family protein n=1 Tax=Actinotalea sp. K2 TaxID=2939438 RepID=UPI002016B843|nr:caspase family protein [Actinotalea sp. K2]MCL3862932.1 caspase family protein [Actinotalea sp. K2]
MTRRALLIGSQTGGLAGANNDVALMQETLAARGFETRVQIDEQATRRGIIDAYLKLISDTEAGSTDPAVVYYAGHGGYALASDWAERKQRGERFDMRYLVPFDMEATTETEFRGIPAEQLSVLQRRLTEKTRNVVTILDCCFSGTMSRDPRLMPRSLPRAYPMDNAWVELAELERQVQAGELRGFSNPDAVRVVACDPTQSAYEEDGQLGRHGVLTTQLALILREMGERNVSWRVLVDRIRHRINRSLTLQRPEVEGPADRLLFSLEVRRAIYALPVRSLDGQPSIEAAGLFGVSVGDVFRILSEDEQPVVTASVRAVVDDRAQLDVPYGLAVNLPPTLLADPVSATTTRGVRLDLAPPLDAVVARAVEGSPLLHVAGDAEPTVATIVGNAALRVQDPTGLPLREESLTSDDAGALLAVRLVERIARAERMRSLTSSPGAADSLRVRVEYAIHDDSGRRVLQPGEVLYPGDRVNLTITNVSDSTLYVGVFDLDTAYKVNLLHNAEPGGMKLPAGESRVLGGANGGSLMWDEGVPEDAPRLESLMVIASTAPQEFTLLQTPRSRGADEPPRSELELLLLEAATGQRAFPIEDDAPSAGYRVQTVDFMLSPGARPDTAEPPFSIREVSRFATTAAGPRAAIPPPSRVAVRLTELRVHNNKALLRSEVRLDALVVTATHDGVVATPFTFPFPGIADGDLLPIDNLRVFLGPVRDFLDIAIWVNRNDRKGADLAQLFETALAKPATQASLSVVGGLVLAAPQVAAAVGAVAAVASIICLGADLVGKAVGKEIGLYRTGFLEHEQFGVGRHPAAGARMAQGISFAYEVLDVSPHAGGGGKS